MARLKLFEKIPLAILELYIWVREGAIAFSANFNGFIAIAKISVTSPIVINMPTRVLSAGETKNSFV